MKMRTVIKQKSPEFCSERFSPTSPFAPAQGFSFTHDRELKRSWIRCLICRCPIIRDSSSLLCLGCVADHASPIQDILNRKASKSGAFLRGVTGNGTEFLLSEVQGPSRGGQKTPLKSKINPLRRHSVRRSQPHLEAPND